MARMSRFREPLGCLVASIGILPLALVVLAVIGLSRWAGASPDGRPEGALTILLVALGVGLVLLAGIIGLGIHFFRNTDWKDYDSKHD